jgi:hypothetical protein
MERNAINSKSCQLKSKKVPKSYSLSLSVFIMEQQSTSTTTETTPTTSETTQMRRIGRVERWLRNGYGFINDLGLVDTDDAHSHYGFRRDQISGSKVFVYHSALVTQSDHVFHRLFAHEYVEYTLDPARPRSEPDGRYQAFNITGLQRQALLCDLTATDNQHQQHPQYQQYHQQHHNHGHVQLPQRHARAHRSQGLPRIPSGARTVVYYVNADSRSAPAIPQTRPDEPQYVLPVNGIPVPK